MWCGAAGVRVYGAHHLHQGVYRILFVLCACMQQRLGRVSRFDLMRACIFVLPSEDFALQHAIFYLHVDQSYRCGSISFLCAAVDALVIQQYVRTSTACYQRAAKTSRVMPGERSSFMCTSCCIDHDKQESAERSWKGDSKSLYLLVHHCVYSSLCPSKVRSGSLRNHSGLGTEVQQWIEKQRLTWRLPRQVT